jgi:phage baseplate assembly protein W
MATFIKNNSTSAVPIGLTLPIQDGDSGYFAQSFDTLTQVKTNIINLLNTRQGERRFQPTFGTRLWDLIFEQDVDTLKDRAINIVTEDIATWIPNVTVIDVTANLLTTDQITANRDIYMLEISVSFMINITKQTDTVIVTINNVTQ